MLPAPGAAPPVWGRRRAWERSKRCPHNTSQRWEGLHSVGQSLTHTRRACSSEPRNHVAQTCQVVCSGQGSLPVRSSIEGQRMTGLVKACQTPAQLQLLLSQHAPASLNHIHVTAIATQLAHLLTKPEIRTTSQTCHADRQAGSTEDSTEPYRLLSQVLHLTDLQLYSLDSRGLANVLWALASCSSSLGLCTHSQPPSPLPALASTPTVSSQRANGINGSSSPSVLNGSIVALSTRSSRDGSSWDMGVSGLTLDAQLHVVAARLFQRACTAGWEHYNAQQICNMLWAAGSLKLHVNEGQVHSMLAAAVERAQHLTSQGLSNILWACAQLGVRPTGSILALAPELLTHAEPQAFASTLWAVAQLGLQPPASWLTDVLCRAEPRLHKFNSQALANTAWALARLGCPPPAAWMDSFLSACIHRLPDLQPQHWSSLMWALSSLSSLPRCEAVQQELHHVQLVAAPGHHEGTQAAGQPGQAVQLCVRPTPECIAKFAGRAQAVLCELPEQELATLSKALADLGWHPGSVWVSTWVEAVQAACMSDSMQRRPLSSCIAAAASWCRQAAEQGQSQVHHESVSALILTFDQACMCLARQCMQQQAQGGDSRSESQTAGDHMGLQLLTALSALASNYQPAWAGAQLQGVAALIGVGKDFAMSSVAGALTLQQHTNLCWALARLGQVPSQPWSRQVLGGLVQQCVHQLQQGKQPLSDQELAMLVWVCHQWQAQLCAIPLLQAMADHPPSQAGLARDAALPRSNPSLMPMAWVSLSLAALGSVWNQPWPAQQQTTDQHSPAAPPPQGQVTAASMHTLALRLLQQAGLQAACMTGQELTRCLCAAARMGYQPSRAWAAAMQYRTLQLAAAGQLAHQLHLCMWALARLGIRPDPQDASHLLNVCLLSGEASGAQLVCSTHPQRLCNVLTACRGWGMQPHPSWVTAVLSHPAWPACLPPAATSSTAAAAPSWSSRDLRVLLTDLVALQVQPPQEWLHLVRQQILEQTQTYAAQHSSSSSSQQRGRVFPDAHAHTLGLALQLLSPEESRQVALLLAAGQRSRAAAAAQPPQWIVVGFETAERHLAFMSLSGMSALLTAAARYVKVRRMAGLLDNLLTTFYIVSAPLLPGAAPHQLLRVLHSLGSLKAHLSPSWAAEVLEVLSADRFTHLSDAQLLDLLPALTSVHCKPEPAWLSDYLMALWHRLVPDDSDPGAAALQQALQPHMATVTSATLLQRSASADMDQGGDVGVDTQGSTMQLQRPAPRELRTQDTANQQEPGQGSAQGAGVLNSRSPDHQRRAASVHAGQAGHRSRRTDTEFSRLAERLGALSSALMKLDPELARAWRAKVVLAYGPAAASS